MEEDIDTRIKRTIENEYKTAKQLSEELNEPKTRIHMRLKAMRRRGTVTFIPSENNGMLGVKPLKYKKSVNA